VDTGSEQPPVFLSDTSRTWTTKPRQVECLVGVFTTGSTEGQRVMEHPRDINLPVANIIGQSYVGAGNMAGKYQGLL